MPLEFPLKNLNITHKLLKLMTIKYSRANFVALGGMYAKKYFSNLHKFKQHCVSYTLSNGRPNLPQVLATKYFSLKHTHTLPFYYNSCWLLLYKYEDKDIQIFFGASWDNVVKIVAKILKAENVFKTHP